MSDLISALILRLRHEVSSKAIRMQFPSALAIHAQALGIEQRVLTACKTECCEAAQIVANAMQELPSGDRELLARELHNGGSVAPLSEAAMDVLFAAAASLMSQSRLDEAMKAFWCLCMLETYEYRNWVSLGHCAYHSGQFEVALTAYYVATSLYPESPWPCIWTAHACERMGETEAVPTLLMRARELALSSSDKEAHLLAENLFLSYRS